MSSTVNINESMVYTFSKSTHQGNRKYMEDVAQIKTDMATKTSFFAIFDGHGGKEAAQFARKHLWKNLKNTDGFESSDSEKVKNAIKEAFLATHNSMKNDIGKEKYNVVTHCSFNCRYNYFVIFQQMIFLNVIIRPTSRNKESKPVARSLPPPKVLNTFIKKLGFL